MAIFGVDKEVVEELERQIKELKKQLDAKNIEIANLKVELENAPKLSSKQIQIFEKNLNENVEKVKKYRGIISAFGINPEKTFYRYKVDIKYFYTGKKFTELLEALQKENIFYLDDLNDLRLHSLPEDIKFLTEGKKKFEDFKQGKIDWKIITLMNKGEEISKIFPKSTKIYKVFADLSYEYMDDINNYNFASLVGPLFTSEQIEEYKTKRDNYYKECRMEKY